MKHQQVKSTKFPKTFFDSVALVRRIRALHNQKYSLVDIVKSMLIQDFSAALYWQTAIHSKKKKKNLSCAARNEQIKGILWNPSKQVGKIIYTKITVRW